MSPTHAHRSRSTQGRAAVLGLVAIILAAGFALNHRFQHITQGSQPMLAASSIAADASASSELSCGGIGINGDFVASATIEITNHAAAPRNVTPLVVSDSHSAVSAASFTIAPNSSWDFNPAQVLDKGNWLSVRLVADGGGVSAVIVPTSGRSATVTPCLSQTSTHWYFSGGSTSHGDQIDYSVFNPTATPAVVGVTLVSGSGVITPQNAQGLLIPPGGQFVVSGLGEAPHASSLAMVVTAEQGAVVAFATQLRPSTLSSTIMPGQPALFDDAVLPHATQDPVSTEVLAMANPSAKTLTVTVTAQTPYGRTAPWVLNVTPYSTSNLTLTGSPRIPLTSPYSLTVHSVGGGVSSELTTVALHANRAGLSMSPLSPMLEASSSLVPGWSGSRLSSLSLFNPGTKTVTAEISMGSQRGKVQVSPGSVLSVSNALLDANPARSVRITGPVFAGTTYVGGVVPSLGLFSALMQN